jgi:type II secretory pathway pseudopilin PulG
MNAKIRALMLRAAVSLAVGVVVFVTAYICAWRTGGGNATPEQFYAAIVDLRQLQQAVDLYRSETGAPPSNLGDALRVHYQKWGRWPAVELYPPQIAPAVGEQPDLQKVEGALDPWHRPYQLVAEEGKTVVYSYGQDGQPGGNGYDADLYSDGFGRGKAFPTLKQFIAYDRRVIGGGGAEANAVHTGWAGAFIPCLVAGGVAFMASLVLTARRRHGPPDRRSIGFALAATALISIFAAVILAGLHLVPSGH